MKVLVVDDDVDLLDLMTYALRREGYNVLAAVDGQQALQRWESESPDIVLLDGNLPKIDGFEVCRRIRHESKTPIIMLTARDEEEDLVLDLQSHEVTKAGKPVQLTRLEFRILYMLALNEGRIIPYSRLIEYAWGYYDEGKSNLLKTHICHIRKKLALAPSGKRGIKAVLGVGYSLSRG